MITQRNGVHIKGIQTLQCDAFGCQREMKFAPVFQEDQIMQLAGSEFKRVGKRHFCRNCAFAMTSKIFNGDAE